MFSALQQTDLSLSSGVSSEVSTCLHPNSSHKQHSPHSFWGICQQMFYSRTNLIDCVSNFSLNCELLQLYVLWLFLDGWESLDFGPSISCFKTNHIFQLDTLLELLTFDVFCLHFLFYYWTSIGSIDQLYLIGQGTAIDSFTAPATSTLNQLRFACTQAGSHLQICFLSASLIVNYMSNQLDWNYPILFTVPNCGKLVFHEDLLLDTFMN